MKKNSASMNQSGPKPNPLSGLVKSPRKVCVVIGKPFGEGNTPAEIKAYWMNGSIRKMKTPTGSHSLVSRSSVNCPDPLRSYDAG